MPDPGITREALEALIACVDCNQCQAAFICGMGITADLRFLAAYALAEHIARGEAEAALGAEHGRAEWLAATHAARCKETLCDECPNWGPCPIEKRVTRVYDRDWLIAAARAVKGDAPDD